MRHAPGVLLATLLVFASLSVPAVGAADVTLTVTVLDQDDETVAGATLEASWDGGSSTATTANNGKAFLDVPEGADVTIEVSHPDYVRNQRFTVTDASEEDVEIPVWQKGRMRLRVVNATEPLVGADVSFTKDQYTRHAETNETGVLASGPIEQGTYTVRAVFPGYSRETVTVPVDGNVSRTILLEPTSVQVEFRVVDDHFDDPRPLENAQVTVFRDGNQIASAETLSNGEQTVSVPVNTRLRVTVEKDGYVATERTVQIGESAQQFDFSISRTPAINVDILSDRVVAGETTIVEATDEYGTPVSGATVLLDGESVGQTNDAGEFRLQVEDVGDHEVQVRRGDLSSDPVTLTAVSGTTATTTTTTPTTTTPTTTTTTTTPTTTTESSGIPGFTAAAALLALVAAVVAVARRR